MAGYSESSFRPLRAASRYRRLALALGLAAFCAGTLLSRAALQFDVFLGYDWIVPQASWFPVVCEIKNDGPAFVGTVEVEGGRFNQGQVRRAVVELPTGTLKRIVIPVFSSSGGYGGWDVRLLDERGRVRAEQPGLQPRKQVSSITPVIGALVRTPGGTPVLRRTLPSDAGLQPAAARLLSSIFPDNPLVLEGLRCVYLSSEAALDLKVDQVKALFAWLNGGGHLIVGIEQVSDVTATPWLRNVLPCELNDMQTVHGHSELEEWLRSAPWPASPAGAQGQPRSYGQRRSAPRPNASAENPFSDLPDDPAFETASLQVAVGKVRDGQVVVSVGDKPLIVTANRGNGRVTLLLFSPEREPFRSWKNLPTFWSRLAEVPGAWYVSSDFHQWGGWSSDGIFGAMLDTRQVHKLPVTWLLLLLIVYLVVIGPLDQHWLKRIGRPMLTWITFPCYVVLFSLLIYFIGYKLRAGESEWNELHLVDVLQKGGQAELHGQTYASVYSPSNQRYLLQSQQEYATLRSEFAGTFSGGQTGDKATFLQRGDGAFQAEIFVPVWTSQLLVSDWWEPAPVPLSMSVAPKGEQWQVKVENQTEHALTDAHIVIDDYIMSLGEIPARATKTFTVAKAGGMSLDEFVLRYGGMFQRAVQSRQRTFGGNASGRIDDPVNGSMAASFLSHLASAENSRTHFIEPPGLDLSSVVEHGNAVLLAWSADYSPVKPLRQFTPRRSHKNTLWRVAVPVESPASKVLSLN